MIGFGSSRLSTVGRAAAGTVTFGLLALVAWSSSPSRAVPDPVAIDAPASVFSSGRAMAHLARIAHTAHPTGSPEHTRVREYLLRQFRELGHDPVVRIASVLRTYPAQLALAATVRNILVRIRGTGTGPAVLVTAHYDSAGITVGAADDGSGVVAILEAVRALGTGPPLANDVIVLISDAEEIDLLGAEAFAGGHPWMNDVAVVLGFDMRGAAGPSIMFETGINNGWVIEAFRDADPSPFANSISWEVYKRLPNDTDFSVFKAYGKQGLNFAGMGKPHVYHQAYDSVANLSEATLQHHGVHALALLRHFGNADLTSVDAPDVNFISLPVLGMIVYGEAWNWVFGGLVVAGWALVVVVAMRRRPVAMPILAGIGASLLYLVCIAFAASGLFAWRRDDHPELGALVAGQFHSEGWYVLAIAAFALAAGALLFGLLRRRFAPEGLAAGALLIPMLLAAAATFAIPFGAMNLQWPVLAGCVAVVALTTARQREQLALGPWLGVTAGAVAALVVLVPIIEGLWLAVNLPWAWAAIAVLIGLAVLVLLPAIQLVSARWYVVPAIGTLAGVAFLVVADQHAVPTVDRPAPATLVYLLDNEDGTAHWGSDPRRTDADPGVQWVSKHVGEFGAATLVPGLGLPNPWYRLAPAPHVEAEPPEVVLVQSNPDVAGVSVRSRIGAEMMLFQSVTEEIRLVAVDGNRLPGGQYRLEYWGLPSEAAGVRLDFEVPDGRDVLRFLVVEHLLRPEELLGDAYFAMPTELAPNVQRSSHRAVIRTPVTVDLRSGQVRMGD